MRYPEGARMPEAQNAKAIHRVLSASVKNFAGAVTAEELGAAGQLVATAAAGRETAASVSR